MTSATSELANMQTWTAYEQASQQVNGKGNDMNQDMFLRLMMEQLKYQDPLNPMSNTEFLAQQAQFTQLNELQKMNTQMVSNDTVQQCISLVGREVELIDPDDTTKTITGVVTEATFDANGSSIKVNGKNYPLGLVLGVREVGTTAETPVTDPPTAENGGTATTASEETAENEARSSFLSSVSKIAALADYLIGKYIK